MTQTLPDISIVIPVYNSQSTLPVLYAEIEKAMAGQNWEVIFVDDGSRDESWLQLRKLKELYPAHIIAVRLRRNFGQHNALACGFGFARGMLTVTMDDDLQHPPSEIPKLLACAAETGADVVYGQYISKQHPGWRNAGSWIMRRSSAYVTGKNGNGSSFRLLKTDIAQKLSAHIQTGFLFIDEVLHWYTSRIASTPVEHHPRREGKSTYSRIKLLALYTNIVIHYTALPLKLMTWIGLLTSLVTFILGVRFIWMKIAHGSVPGFTATIVVILFSTSLLMFCMGIIGQYLYNLYKMQNRRPSYSVEEIL
ncbi:MAG: glycosyltransferase family 2 protein [Bacteroidetes bacterium]|nr:glycosyltransferase family 2 protein [Bacteroidota bacterium]